MTARAPTTTLFPTVIAPMIFAPARMLTLSPMVGADQNVEVDRYLLTDRAITAYASSMNDRGEGVLKEKTWNQ